MPGNTSDNTTLAGFVEKIEKQYGRSDRVRIMDRGIPTEATLATMREGDAPVHYLVGTPKGRLTKLETSFLGKPWQAVRPCVEVKLLAEEGELYTRQLHNIAAYLAYAEHPASSPRAANTESFPVCATTRKASVRRVRRPHPCEEDAHAPMGSKSPAFKGRASPLTRDLCNIRVHPGPQ